MTSQEQLRASLERMIREGEWRIEDLEEAMARARSTASDLMRRIDSPPTRWEGKPRWYPEELANLRVRMHRCWTREAKLKSAIEKTTRRLEVLRARLASVPDKVEAPAPAPAGAPLACCQSFLVTLLAGRAPVHHTACSGGGR